MLTAAAGRTPRRRRLADLDEGRAERRQQRRQLRRPLVRVRVQIAADVVGGGASQVPLAIDPQDRRRRRRRAARRVARRPRRGRTILRVRRRRAPRKAARAVARRRRAELCICGDAVAVDALPRAQLELAAADGGALADRGLPGVLAAVRPPDGCGSTAQIKSAARPRATSARNSRACALYEPRSRDRRRVLPREDLRARRHRGALLDPLLDEVVLADEVAHVVDGVVGDRLLAVVQRVVRRQDELHHDRPHRRRRRRLAGPPPGRRRSEATARRSSSSGCRARGATC